MSDFWERVMECDHKNESDTYHELVSALPISAMRQNGIVWIVAFILLHVLVASMDKAAGLKSGGGNNVQNRD